VSVAVAILKNLETIKKSVSIRDRKIS
jgi:hypothetical protein